MPASRPSADAAGAPRPSAAARPPGARLGFPDLHGRSELVIAILIDSLGSGLFLPFAVLYATVAAHLPIATTGLVLSLAAVAALPAAPLAGALVDRLGGQCVVIAANLLQALGFGGYPFIAAPTTLFACGFAVAVGSQLYWAANGAFVADLAPSAQRARWFALLGACRSAGLGSGALLSGLVAAVVGASGYQLLAGVNALSFLCAALLIARVSVSKPVGASSTAKPRATWRHGALNAWASLGGYRSVLRDRPFLGFTATNFAFSLVVLSSTIVLPLYIVGPLRQSVATPGLLFGMNTALVVTMQTTVARWSERYRRTRALAFAAGLFAMALLQLAGLEPLTHAIAGSHGWTLVGLIGAMLIYTVAELIMAPLKNALVADAAPDALRGRYLAFYHLSWSAASTVAPALLTTLFALGAGWLWLALSVVALVALLALIRLDRQLPIHAVFPAGASARLAAD